MRVIDYSLRLSLITALILIGARLEPTGIATLEAETRPAKSVVSRVGLDFVASLSKDVVSGDELITLTLTLTNKTKKEIVVIESNPLADYKIDVRDGRDALVPPTPEGKDLLFRSQWGGRRLSVTIAPGEIKTDTFQVNKIYAMVNPGSYTISASRRARSKVGGPWVELRSNKVVATVRR